MHEKVYDLIDYVFPHYELSDGIRIASKRRSMSNSKQLHQADCVTFNLFMTTILMGFSQTLWLSTF